MKLVPDRLRVAWDSCTIIDYLKGAARAKECKIIIAAAERGEIEIVVSAMAEAEVIKIDAPSFTDAQEAMIEEFFGRTYILPISVTSKIAAAARRLSRTYGLKAPDAIHVATALAIPDVRALESYDDDDMDKIRKSATPLPRQLLIRHPTYEGQQPLLASSGGQTD